MPRLKDLTTDGRGHYGINAPGIPWNASAYTYLRITDIREDGRLSRTDLKSVETEDDRFLLKPNDIVFARTGASAGRSYFFDGRDGDLVYAGYLIKFSLDPEKAEPKYVKYYCQSPAYRDWVSSHSTGSTRPNLNAVMFSDLEIPLPGRKTQRQIAAVLGAFDDKIETNDRIIKNLQEQYSSIFSFYFVTFDKYNGVIPDDWKYISFEAILTQRSEKSSDSRIPLFAVTDKGILPREMKFNKNLSKVGTKNKVVHETDIVFGMSRKILNWGIFHDRIGAVSSAYQVFEVDPEIDSLYLESFITSRPTYFADLIRPAAREGQSIDKAVLFSKELLLPDIRVLHEYHDLTDPIMNTIRHIKRENSTLMSIRDTLLPRLMSGEIDVSNVKLDDLADEAASGAAVEF